MQKCTQHVNGLLNVYKPHQPANISSSSQTFCKNLPACITFIKFFNQYYMYYTYLNLKKEKSE